VFTFNVDGKFFPCPADVTIGEFYERVMKSPVVAPTALARPLEIRPGGIDKPLVLKGPWEAIGKNDIVRFIAQVAPEAETDLVTGNLYRVIGIHKQGGVVSAYDVVDDNSPTRIRMTVSPDMIQFERKAIPMIPKLSVFETTETCACGEKVVLERKPGDEKYVGKCECGAVMEKVLSPTANGSLMA
jgi:hypothetical protein